MALVAAFLAPLAAGVMHYLPSRYGPDVVDPELGRRVLLACMAFCILVLCSEFRPLLNWFSGFKQVSKSPLIALALSCGAVAVVGLFYLGRYVASDYQAFEELTDDPRGTRLSNAQSFLGLTAKQVCVSRLPDGTAYPPSTSSPVVLLPVNADHYVTWDRDRGARRWPKEGLVLTPPTAASC